MVKPGTGKEVYFTKPTSDGWVLQLIRYPAVTSTKAQTPVVLCHGLAANRYSVDFGEIGTPEWNKYSLAAYLSRGGKKHGLSFDVWVPELRGRGEHPTFDPKTQPEKYRWCLDEYIEKDAPVIITSIQEWYNKNEKRNPKVFWIGKSMGGMIAYAYGQTTRGNKTLKGVVTLGSPVAFESELLGINLLTTICPRNIFIPLNIAEVLKDHPELREKFKESSVNPTNIEPKIFNEYLEKGMNNTISSKVLSHFSVFFRHNTFCKYPRNPWLYDLLGRFPGIGTYVAPYSYKENLTKFTSPLLAMSGSLDKVAPSEDIQFLVQHVGSKDVTYVNLSKENGYSNDYGHIDLTLGLKVKHEVYPIIHEWVKERD